MSYVALDGSGDLPAGGDLDPDFTTDWWARATSLNGLNNANDIFELTAGGTPHPSFDEFLASLDDGSLRVGLGIFIPRPEGAFLNASYVNVPRVQQVAEPDSLALLGLSILTVAVIARRSLR